MPGGLGRGDSPGGPFLTHWGPLASLVFSGPHSSDRQNKGAGGHGHYVPLRLQGLVCVHVSVCVSLGHALPYLNGPNSALVQLAFHQRPVRNPRATEK